MSPTDTLRNGIGRPRASVERRPFGPTLPEPADALRLSAARARDVPADDPTTANPPPSDARAGTPLSNGRASTPLNDATASTVADHRAAGDNR